MLSIFKIKLAFLVFYCFQHFSGSSVYAHLVLTLWNFGCKSRQLPGHMLSALVAGKIRDCHYIEIPAGIQFSSVPVETS